MKHITYYIERKTIYEFEKQNKKFQKLSSCLYFIEINDSICLLGGLNYGKAYYKNRKYNNRKF